MERRTFLGSLAALLAAPRALLALRPARAANMEGYQLVEIEYSARGQLNVWVDGEPQRGGGRYWDAKGVLRTADTPPPSESYFVQFRISPRGLEQISVADRRHYPDAGIRWGAPKGAVYNVGDYFAPR